MNDEVNQLATTDFTDEELGKLGLSEHPFTDHAGDAYLYNDSQIEMTSNIIMEYLTNPTTTIILTGEEGVGKTTYLRKVLRLGYQQYQFCTLRARQDSNFLDIENKIKQRWVVPPSNERSVVDLSIENYVITYLREHTHAVLIIDDADFLDTATLDRLFTLKHRIALACPSGLGLILAGENDLKLKISELEDTNPACTQVYQINVRPLSREQTSKYINHRLTTAGLEGEILFDESQIDEIYKVSEGNIRLIHQHAVDYLKSQFEEENSFDAELDQHIIIRKRKPRIPLVLITIIALLGFGLYVNHRQKIEKEKEIAISIPKQKELAQEQALSPLAQEANTSITNKTPSLPVPNLYTDILENSENNKANSNVEVIEKGVQGMDIAALKNLEEKLQEVVEDPTLVEEKSEETSLITEQENKKVIKTKLKKDKPSHGTEWLLGLNESSYTLQVVATKESSQLEKLIKKEQLSRDYAYFPKPVKDATYYVLVIGNFKSREEAINSVDKLPENLRKNNPWPVKLDSVQTYLK